MDVKNLVTPWYIRLFVFPFLKNHYSSDFGKEFDVVIRSKYWRGILYIVEETRTPTSKNSEAGVTRSRLITIKELDKQFEGATHVFSRFVNFLDSITIKSKGSHSISISSAPVISDGSLLGMEMDGREIMEKHNSALPMPKGWKNIEYLVKKVPATMVGPDGHLRDVIEVLLISPMLDLMKEMAEALEDISKSCDQGYLDSQTNASVVTIDEDDFYSCCGSPRDLADRILMKFKEWK